MDITRIGRYEIISVLGEGGMGKVFKAKDTIIGRTVAIKTIIFAGSESKSQAQDLVGRFYQEAQIIGKLSHPNITTVHDVGEDKGRHFLVMEYVEGVTLQKVISGEVDLSLQEKIGVLIQGTNALHHAHQIGVIHRDIKPANIMIQKDNQVKVMDFGIAKIFGENASVHTQDGIVMGTIAYMSPEQMTGAPLDRRTDIFSIGVIAWALLTGQKLKPMDFPPKPDSRVPEALFAIVSKALEKNRENRYPSAGALADALEIFLNQMEKEKEKEPLTIKTHNTRDLLTLLKKNYPFFWDFSDEEIKKIFNISARKLYTKGEVIFKEGSVGNKMYVIISGDVHITKRFQNHETLLNKLQAGDCFGEMGIIGATTRFASARAETDSLLIAINEVILRNSQPLLCLKLYKNLSTILAEKLKKSDIRANKLEAELKKALEGRKG